MDAPSSSRRWVILALLFTARVGLGFQFQTLGSVADPLATSLGLNFTEIGSLIGLFLMPGLVVSIPVGFAGRYLSDRSLIAAGLAALAAGSAMCAAAQGFGMLALGRLVCGMGFVATTIYFTKMVADWFSGRELATSMSVLVMSWPFGIAMGQVGHGWLAGVAGWRAPFIAASLYCLMGAALIWFAYRPPIKAGPAAVATSQRLTKREWILTLNAAVVWGAFNAAYIVYLSFAPRLLIAAGEGPLAAASIISIASWVMIFSGAACGQLSDRTGRSNLILTVCMLSAIASLLLLPHVQWAVALSLVFGLVGMAPAGVIMALTAAAMAPQKRAFGMGIFFMGYFLITTPAAGVAGWLYDRSHDPYLPILFAVALFGLTLAANFVFRFAQHRLAGSSV